MDYVVEELINYSNLQFLEIGIDFKFASFLYNKGVKNIRNMTKMRILAI